MFILANLFYATAHVLNLAITIYIWIIIIRALISWVNPDPYNVIVRFLRGVTDPILNPIRRILPLGFSGIDISPIIAILILIFTKKFIVATLRDIALKLK